MQHNNVESNVTNCPVLYWINCMAWGIRGDSVSCWCCLSAVAADVNATNDCRFAVIFPLSRSVWPLKLCLCSNQCLFFLFFLLPLYRGHRSEFPLYPPCSEERKTGAKFGVMYTTRTRPDRNNNFHTTQHQQEQKEENIQLEHCIHATTAAAATAAN